MESETGPIGQPAEPAAGHGGSVSLVHTYRTPLRGREDIMSEPHAKDLRHPDGCILIFAKAPRPGQVKTRLLPALGAEGAAALHRLLVTQTVATVGNAALAPATLYCTPTSSDPFLAGLAADAGMALAVQQGQDLGERMAAALGATLQQARYAVLVGTDCPALNEAYLAEALEVLASGHDAVLGPALDGGYVLIGLSRPPEASLFDGIPWGSGEVLAHTESRLQALGWSWRALSPLRDLDRPEDLEALWGPRRAVAQ